MTMADAGGPYRVPKRHGGSRAFALAVVMHGVLFAFLWVGIRWNNDPTGVDAEIWDVTTQMAAPKAPEPAPEPEPEPPAREPEPVAPPPEVARPLPKEPDIALEKKKKEKEKKDAEDKKLAELKKKLEDEKKRLADLDQQDKLKKLEEEKAKKQAELKEKEKLAKARAAEMQRIMGSAAAGSTGTAARSTAPRLDDGYKAAIVTKIRSFLNYPGQDDVEAVYTITQLPTGEVLGVRKVKSSGVPAYDTAIENAIRNASPLPKRKDGSVEREITATFKLKEMRQ
ncbi:energy transducer TonB [Pseudoduganella violaceinigra]|uniref:energy transducer TonB n=1 Tax=Pseudoduganella violaceinigra TaxID=246602 RepID=UPI0004876A59|nr:energy transducer TonB [Pseudoduganella violaceinigra]